MNHSVLKNYGIAVRRQRAAQADLRIKLAILVEINDAKRIGSANLPPREGRFSAQQAQQRGLAAAVGAYQPNSHSRSNSEIDSCK